MESSDRQPAQAPEILLLKLGEVVLKGLNRNVFEDRLISNVSRRIRPYGRFQVYTRQSTIYVEPRSETCDMTAAFDACCQVFGVIAVARAVPCGKSVAAISATAKTYLASEFAAAKSFKVESRRADKTFPMTSIQLSQAVGGDLAEAFPGVAVDVHHPDLTVYVEVREKAAYVHAPAVESAGGLPVGMGGRAVSLLSGGIDSPVSSWMMARRGVELEMVHFASPPYTSQQALDKVISLAQLLTPWCGRLTVHVVPFTEIQEEIRRKCPEDYFTLIMRRFMMRLAQATAFRCHAGALITGESLGQVASQTMASLGVTEDVTTLPVLRPLIGMDKSEIVRLSRRIGTFETSILPYEDCCTVFTPRHPNTKPHVEDVRAAESALDVEALTARAMAGSRRIRIRGDGTLAPEKER
jgi:thiamine biosynthesis protein ThiI